MSTDPCRKTETLSSKYIFHGYSVKLLTTFILLDRSYRRIRGMITIVMHHQTYSQIQWPEYLEVHLIEM